jgi:hypothetical protein
VPRAPFVFFFYLYMGLGVLSLLLGLVVAFAPGWVLGGVAATGGIGLNVVAGILILFGLWRIGLAFYHLRRALKP